jgi:predicted ArsR family transcriptional regulator
MKFANDEAVGLQHEYIGTEHLLLGLVRQGDDVAADVLKNLGVDRDKIRAEVQKLIISGPVAVTQRRRPMTPRTKHALKNALLEAKELQHEYMGTEHILLGLIREDEGVAAQIMLNLGLTLSQVREEVMRILRTQTEDAAEALIRRFKGEMPSGIAIGELAELLHANPPDVQRLFMASRAATRLFDVECNKPLLFVLRTIQAFALRLVKALLWSLPVSAFIGWFAESWAVFGISLALIALQNVIHHVISSRQLRMF